MQAWRVVGDIGATLRQWGQPREFRIRAAAWPAEALAALEAVAATEGEGEDAGPGNGATGPPDQAGSAEPPGLSGRSLADVVTSLWRLRNRVAAAPEDTPRPVARHLEMAWDSLTQAGVEIHDHLNDPFDLGLSLTVVAYQPTPGLTREQVIETIRPSIYVNDRVIQAGEVIVGTPDPADGAPPPADQRDRQRSP